MELNWGELLVGADILGILVTLSADHRYLIVKPLRVQRGKRGQDISVEKKGRYGYEGGRSRGDCRL